MLRLQVEIKTAWFYYYEKFQLLRVNIFLFCSPKIAALIGTGAASLGVAMAMAKHYTPAIGVTKIGEGSNQEFLVKHVTGEKKPRSATSGSPKISLKPNESGMEPGEVLVEGTLSPSEADVSTDSHEKNLVIETSVDDDAEEDEEFDAVISDEEEEALTKSLVARSSQK